MEPESAWLDRRGEGSNGAHKHERVSCEQQYVMTRSEAPAER